MPRSGHARADHEREAAAGRRETRRHRRDRRQFQRLNRYLRRADGRINCRSRRRHRRHRRARAHVPGAKLRHDGMEVDRAGRSGDSNRSTCWESGREPGETWNGGHAEGDGPLMSRRQRPEWASAKVPPADSSSTQAGHNASCAVRRGLCACFVVCVRHTHTHTHECRPSPLVAGAADMEALYAEINALRSTRKKAYSRVDAIKRQIAIANRTASLYTAYVGVAPCMIRLGWLSNRGRARSPRSGQKRNRDTDAKRSQRGSVDETADQAARPQEPDEEQPAKKVCSACPKRIVPVVLMMHRCSRSCRRSSPGSYPKPRRQTPLPTMSSLTMRDHPRTTPPPRRRRRDPRPPLSLTTVTRPGRARPAPQAVMAVGGCRGRPTRHAVSECSVLCSVT